MPIIVKNKDTLIFDDFIFKCCLGKNGLTRNKVEGDKKTPIGNFNIDCLYFRNDRKKKPFTKLKSKVIKKYMGWCNDINSKTYYNKLIRTNTELEHEKLFRSDYKYDFFIPIKYNWDKRVIGNGSAIFIHLTKNYTPTAGCIGLSEKDFLILIKLINHKTTIKIL